jgi:hypothetical protein
MVLGMIVAFAMLVVMPLIRARLVSVASFSAGAGRRVLVVVHPAPPLCRRVSRD